MHKRAFEALTKTFMHFSGLPHHVLTKKTIYELIDFFANYGVGRPETCTNEHFRPSNELICKSHVLYYHIFAQKSLHELMIFFWKYDGERPESFIN